MAELTTEDKAAIYDEVSKDKGMSRQVKKFLAEQHPELDMPEVELAAQIEESNARHEKELEEMRTELQSTKDELTASQAEAEFMRTHGITKEGMAEVTQYMEENNITDLESGLRFMRLSEQAPKDEMEGYEGRRTMTLPGDMAEGLKDRRGYRRRKLLQGVKELRDNARRSEVLSTH